MPDYDKKQSELVFGTDESEASCCPVCGGEPDYDVFQVLDESVKYPWKCGECGASGNEFAKLVFDGHRVDFSTLPRETQREYTELKTRCVNGTLRVGDLVLSTIDDDFVPCLPGVVTEINLLGTPEHGTENDTDDVHVDFTGDYSERRKHNIAKHYAEQFGSDKSFEDVNYDNLIMAPTCLIKITGIGDDKLRWVMESEENAVRYAYQVVHEMIAKHKDSE